MFYTVIDCLPAEMVRIMIVKIFKLLPVSAVGIRIISASCGLSGFLNLFQQFSASVGVFFPAFQEETAFLIAICVYNTAHKRCVLIGKYNRADLILRFNAFFGVPPVGNRHFPWNMKLSAVFFQHKSRRHHLTFRRSSVTSQPASAPVPSGSVPKFKKY